jgi:hypothetical protein
MFSPVRRFYHLDLMIFVFGIAQRCCQGSSRN